MGDTTTGWTPYSRQAGGHTTASGAAPASLLDRHGRFLKRLQADDRGTREMAFYAAMEQHRQQQQQPGTHAQQYDCSSCVSALQHSLMCQLAQWVPRSYGSQEVLGQTYLVLEDVTGRYRQPCVLDIKMGYTTAYAWASEALQEKYRCKDASTTQSTLGFRLCGMVVQQAAAASSIPLQQQGAGAGSSSAGHRVLRRDRHWGKQLTADTMADALRSFADNGVLCLHDLCLLGPNSLLQQLQALAVVFEQQQCWHLFSASLLVVYEGSAVSAADTAVCVRVIDFAHAFPVVAVQQEAVEAVRQQQEQPPLSSVPPGPAGPDTNFLRGLESLIKVLQDASGLQDNP